MDFSSYYWWDLPKLSILRVIVFAFLFIIILCFFWLKYKPLYIILFNTLDRFAVILNVFYLSLLFSLVFLGGSFNFIDLCNNVILLGPDEDLIHFDYNILLELFIDRISSRSRINSIPLRDDFIQFSYIEPGNLNMSNDEIASVSNPPLINNSIPDLLPDPITWEIGGVMIDRTNTSTSNSEPIELGSNCSSNTNMPVKGDVLPIDFKGRKILHPSGIVSFSLRNCYSCEIMHNIVDCNGAYKFNFGLGSSNQSIKLSNRLPSLLNVDSNPEKFISWTPGARICSYIDGGPEFDHFSVYPDLAHQSYVNSNFNPMHWLKNVPYSSAAEYCCSNLSSSDSYIFRNPYLHFSPESLIRSSDRCNSVSNLSDNSEKFQYVYDWKVNIRWAMERLSNSKKYLTDLHDSLKK